MKDKLNRKGANKLLIFTALCLLSIVLIGAGFAQQNQSLEEELAQLEQELNDAGYSWLVDYTGDIGPKIEVYEKDGNELIALFENLRENEYNKVYLTNLGQGQCYDDETEILTENGWKLFSELGKDEKVATLNQQTREKEWQKPLERQEFEHDGEMFRIELDYSFSSSKFKSLSVSNISIFFCSLNAFSSDQIGQLLNANDNAKNWISFECGANGFASDACILNSSNEMILTCSLINENTSASSSLDNLLLNTMSSKFLPISKNINSGEINWNLFEREFNLKASNDLPLESNDEYILLVSTTTNILPYLSDSMNLFDNALSVFSDSSLTSSSASLDLATIDLSLANLSNSGLIILAIAKDNVIFDNFLRSDSISAGTDIVTSAITGDMNEKYINVSSEIRSSELLVSPEHNISVGYFDDDRKEELLVSPEHKVYAKINNGNFELMPVKEVYSLINDNEVYFLDRGGKERKVLSIKKEDYSGKIYDVDVANDVVLVRRNKVVCDDYDEENKGSLMVTRRVTDSPPNDNNFNSSNYINVSDIKEKIERGSNRMAEPNRLIPSYDFNNRKYLNVSVDFNDNHAGMAEWLLQLVDTQRPSGPVGSIPTPSVSQINNYSDNVDNLPDGCRVVEGTPFWSGNSEGYSQDTFDLRVVGGSVEFEHIIDPTYYRDIPWGYNLVNDSLNLGTFGAVYSTPTDTDVEGVTNNILGNVNFWFYDGSLPVNLTINFTNSYAFDSIDVWPYPQSSTIYSINQTKIYVSDDSISWTNITGITALWGGVAPATYGHYYTLNLPEQKKKYVRLEIFNFITATFGGSSEIRVYKNTTNLANLTSTTVSATNTLGGSPANIRNKIIGAGNDFWQADGIGNVTFNFSESKRFSFIVVSVFEGCGVENSSIRVSDDGSSWTTVASNLDANKFTAHESFVFNFSEQNKKYLMYEIITPAGGCSNRGTLLEIEIPEQLTGTQVPGGITNNWICSTAGSNFSTGACWSLLRVPAIGDDVIFNATATGNVNITNNTLVQDLNSFTVTSGYTGSIYFNPMFAVGSWGANALGSQEWNVTNDINISGGTMYIYGDYLRAPFGKYNLTNEGHGQIWRSASGNITVGASGKIDGNNLGFPAAVGPATSDAGGGHGGYGGRGAGSGIPDVYGNASAPTSLGSGGLAGLYGPGGSAIKLETVNGIATINGMINMSSLTLGGASRGGAGGSIWLRANNLTGSGVVQADGGVGPNAAGGGGGRIRFDFNSSYSYNGKISTGGGVGGDFVFDRGRPGTFSFSSSLTQENLTYPTTLNLSGGNGVGFAAGNYTILGNLIVSSGTILGVHPLNRTSSNNGTGVVIIVTGNVTIESGGLIDGIKEGFEDGFGPGAGGANQGGTHGGRGGGNSDAPYGSEIEPLSLGSGGDGSYNYFGGGAIKLDATQNIIINGNISANGAGGGGCTRPAAGGSILLKANNISGNGILEADGGLNSGCGAGLGAGGGGRIALHATVIEFKGKINNKGGTTEGPTNIGSGGTVYINATTSMTISGNVSVVGYNGTAGGVDWGQRINITDTLLTLTGVYNATAVNQSASGIKNGTITTNYTSCDSTFTGIFQPPRINEAPNCDSLPPNLSIVYPTNASSFATLTLDVNWTVSSDAQACWWTNSSGKVNASVTCGSNISRTWIEGVNNVTVYANDSSNNLNRSDVRFTIDSTFPLISYGDGGTPVNGSRQKANAIYVNVSVTEVSEGTIVFALHNTSGVVNVSAYTNATRARNWTSLADGTYYFNVSVNDTFGNSNQTATRTVAVDVTNPGVNFTDPTPTNASTQTHASIYVNVSSSDSSDHYAFVDFDKSLVGWWRMDNSTGENDTHVKDWSGYCYDDKTKILTRREVECDSRSYDLEDGIGSDSKLSSNSVISLLSKSSGEDNSTSNSEKEFINDSGLDCGILNQTIENIFSLGKTDELVKCLSFVTNILCSDLEINANLPFLNPFGANKTSNSFDFKNCNSSLSTFSSNRNLSLFGKPDDDIVSTSCKQGGVMQGGFDMLFSDGCRKRIYDFLNWYSGFEHLKNLPNHDSGSFKSWGSAADFSVGNNISINFNSHNSDKGGELYKDFGADRKCYTEEWKYFVELDENDEVMTLNQETGEKEWQLPFERQEFEHEGEMYRVKTSDGDLVVSPEHKVYVKKNYKNSNSSAEINLITSPLNFSGEYCFSIFNITAFCDSKSFAGTLNNQIPKCSEELNLSSMKCLSRVINSLCSDKVNLKTSPFSIVLGDNLTSCPNLVRNDDNPMCTFSSNKNFILFRKGDDKTSFAKLCSEFQRCFDMLFSQGRVCFENFFSRGTVVEHFQDYGNHDSSAFESRLAMADLAVNDNIVVNLDSHDNKNNEEIYKDFYGGRDLFKFELVKISDIYSDIISEKIKVEEFVFLDEDLNEVRVLDISKENYSGKIYDVDVENDIVLVKRLGENGEYSRSFWSGNSNNGTAVGNAQPNASGKFAGAFSFDGINDYAEMGDINALDGIQQLTILAWVKPNGLTAWSYVAGKNIDYGNDHRTSMGLTSPGDDVIIFLSNGSNERAGTSGNIISVGVWHHWAMVFDGTQSSDATKLKFYFDGQNQTLEYIGTVPNITATSAANVNLAGTDAYFNGTIDEVLIFNRSLSANEIKALYNASANKYYNNFTSLSDGAHKFTGYAVDLAGNKNETEQRTVTINSDTLPPNLSIAYPTNASSFATLTLDVNWTVSSDAQTCWWTNSSGKVNATVTCGTNISRAWIEGVNNVTVYANDSSNNVNRSDVRFTIDSTLPVVSIDSPANGTNYTTPTQDIIYSASDANLQSCWWTNSSGVVNQTISCGVGEFSITWTQGVNNVTVYVNDSVGNTAGTNTRFIIDTTNPNINVTGPLNNSFTTLVTFEVNYTVSDYAVGLYQCWWTNNSGKVNYTVTCGANISRAWTEGVNNVTVFANDTLNNINVSSVRFTIDTTLPSISIVLPANGTNYTTATLDVNFTVSDANLQTCWWTNSSGKFNYSITCGANVSRTWTQGVNNVTVYVNDTAGNAAGTNTRFVIDSIVPLISFGELTESNGTKLTRANIHVNVSVTETNEGTIVFALHNTSGVYNVSAYTNATRFRNYTGLADGTYYFNVSVNDTFGNSNQTATRTVVIDATVPLISYGAGTENDGDVLDRGNIYVNVSVTEANEGTIVFRLHNTSGVVNVSAYTNATRARNWTSLADGTYTFNVTVNDTAGNSNTTATRTILVISSCLNSGACNESSSCTVTEACLLHNGLCTNSICDFTDFIMKADVYTLYDSNRNARNLDLNLSQNISFFSGTNFSFSGKNGSDIGAGSLGGNAGVLNITVPLLLNTTNAKFVGRGGYTTKSGAGGDGGILQLNFHGLVRNFTLGTSGINLTAGNSSNNTFGFSPASTGGALIYKKDIAITARLPYRDADVNGDGRVTGADVLTITDSYNNVTGSGGYTNDKDINGDGILNVKDLVRVGFAWNTR